MFQVLRKTLGRLGVRLWSDDEYINAEQDDKLHEHSKAADALRGAAVKRREANVALRDSIARARRTTSEVFADFEKLIEADRKQRYENDD